MPALPPLARLHHAWLQPVLVAAVLASLGASGCATTLDKAQTAHQDGAYDEAELLYDKAGNDPELAADARRGLADLHVDRADASTPQEAEGHLRDALAIDPVHDAALTALVRLLRRSDRLQDASQVLSQAAASGPCGACKRLALVVTLERADVAFAAEDWPKALTLYTSAHKQRVQPAVSVAIAATHLAAGDATQAEAALVEAGPLLLSAEASTAERFVSLRAQLLDQALAAKDFETADRVAAIVAPKEPASEATDRAVRIARAVDEQGDPEVARLRFESLREVTGEAALRDPQRKAIEDRLATLYGDRGTAQLHAGDAALAQAEFEKAIALRNDDWLLKLQRILALSTTTGAAPALAGLAKVPGKVAGLAHARAIVLSMRVQEHVREGDLEAAQISLDKAKRAHPDLPEVHLAAATVLASTPTDELSARDRKALLGRKGMVSYPDEVYRYAEALAELEWIASELDNRKPDYPFTAPWLQTEFDALSRRLASAYPYAVEFQPEPEPVVLLKNRSAAFVEVSVSGADGFSDELGIPPGDTREVVPPDSGLLRLRIGRTRRVYYAEGYAKVTVLVP